MSRRLKGLLWLGALGAALLLALLGRMAGGAALALAAFGWLAWEARRRQTGHFGGGELSERSLALPAPALGAQASAGGGFLLLNHAGGRVSLVDVGAMALSWERGFSEPPLAALPLDDGRLLWAGETRLHLSDADGVDQAELAFDAPLLRQAYRLSLSGDGTRALLSTPWSAVVAQADLGAALGGVRWEDAGHYFKHAGLSPDGQGLLLGGALLLDEADSGGGAMQGRWGLWRRGSDGAWARSWAQAAESYANTHLRALHWMGAGLIAVELQDQGHEFRLLGADGSERWRRRGEHPVASPGLQRLAFETEAGLHVGGLDGAEQWRWAHQEQLRGLRLFDDGSALALEGLQIRGFDAAGRLRWTRRWKRDPQHAALLPAGAVAVDGDRLGLLRLPRVRA